VLDHGLVDETGHDYTKRRLGIVHRLLEVLRVKHPGGAYDGLA
jgi:hypothetical protein